MDIVQKYIMEESKYYTPNKDEFVTGLRFQVRLQDDIWVDFEWNHTIGMHNVLKGGWVPSGWTLKEKLDSGDVRVKYLDRKDIESEGWAYSNELKEAYGTQPHGTIYNKEIDFRGEKKIANLFHISQSNYVLITPIGFCVEKRIIDSNEIYTIHSGSLFSGTLLNVSELKNQLKRCMI